MGYGTKFANLEDILSILLKPKVQLKIDGKDSGNESTLTGWRDCRVNSTSFPPIQASLSS